MGLLKNIVSLVLIFLLILIALKLIEKTFRSKTPTFMFGIQTALAVFLETLCKIWYSCLVFRGRMLPLSHDRVSHTPVA